MTNLGIHTVTSSKNPIAAQKSSNPSLMHSHDSAIVVHRYYIKYCYNCLEQSCSHQIQWSMDKSLVSLVAKMGMMAKMQATLAAEEVMKTPRCQDFCFSGLNLRQSLPLPLNLLPFPLNWLLPSISMPLSSSIFFNIHSSDNNETFCDTMSLM